MDYNNETEQEWMEQLKKSRGRDAESTLKFAEKILQAGMNKNDSMLIGFAYFYIGETYYTLNDIGEFFRNIMLGLNHLQSSGQWELTAKACNLLGIASYNQGNAPFALDYYLSGTALCERHQLTYIKSIIEYNIGTIFMCHGEYNRALPYLESSRQLFAAMPKEQDAEDYLRIVYISLASCYLGKEDLEKTGKLLESAQQANKNVSQNIINLSLLCVEARYYNELKDFDKRDGSIQKLEENMNHNLTVVEVFDDFYVYCQMLLRIEKYRELWHMLEILEGAVQESKLLHLWLKLLTVKIEYFKKIEDQDGFLLATGLFYELSKSMEEEKGIILDSMLNLRFSLEEARKKCKEVEAWNLELQKKSEMDALTGVANRLGLNKYAEEAFLRALNENSFFSVEILDLDFFKEYNDNYGHPSGDACLIAVANEVRQLTNYGNIFCARYGGDEFIILYEKYDKDQVLKMAGELRNNIMELAIEHKFSEAYPILTISQGICCDIPKKGYKVWDFLYSADVMLYRVKNNCRNAIALSQCNSSSAIQIQETGTKNHDLDII